MGALLDWAGGFLAPVAHQAGAELRLSNHLAGVWFDADRHRLEQVLLNLALNALRAVRQDGWVEISGRQVPPGETPAIAIRVRDSGTGIAEEAGKRLFEPGFTTRPGSPGLGLAVCRRIVEQHGGTLEAANRAGGGACFTVKLPWGGNVSREIAAREITRVEAAG
jgi:signal transduction histidine kinase